MRARATPSKVESRAPDGAVHVLSPTLSSSGSCGGGNCGFTPQEVLGDSGALGGYTGALQKSPRVLVTCGKAGTEGGLIAVLKSQLLTCSGVSGTREREKVQ